jgi:adenylate cyclase class 2
MPIEIEAKMKVANFDEVLKALEKLGAQRVGEIFEINTFLDTEDRSLLAGDQGLRVRTNRDVATGAETIVCTFKGPRLHGALKSREELELDVASARDAEKLFEALGYERVLSFEKKRRKYKHAGCSIELDELPHLGTYVEIEGPDEAAVQKVRDALGLAKVPVIKGSYVGMLMSHLQDHGRHERVVSFAK